MTAHGHERPEESTGSKRPTGSEESAGSQESTGSEDEVAELKEEVAQLQQAVQSHAIVDQAIGLLVGLGQITPAEAWDALREVSMNTNTKLREVAETLIDWGCSGVLPGEIRVELERRLMDKRHNSQCADAEPPTA
ncbi:ANTAR domain-containing protein [Streptomyces sp. NPDC087300]|uniref:ANTAR domain-containing protein n=1 Tax=Streptomyces sp. NPDC087300 TaxID=3365780 RepID=UPI00381ED825